MFYNRFDSHMHSNNSPDAVDSVEAMCKAAIDKGLAGIAITDHCEFDQMDTHDYTKWIAQSAKDVLAAKEAFRGRLEVALGVEMAQPHRDWTEVDRILQAQPYDFVLASVHRVDGQDDYYTVDYTTLSQKQIDNMFELYFESLLDYAKQGNYDVMAHLTFPLRCAMRNNGVSIDPRRYADHLEEVMKVIVQRGKGIEINTSGLRCVLGDTMPPFWVVRRFRQLGGEYVTISSDAHKAVDVGTGQQAAMGYLSEAGFEYFAFYRQRKPVMLRVL